MMFPGDPPPDQVQDEQGQIWRVASRSEPDAQGICLLMLERADESGMNYISTAWVQWPLLEVEAAP